jgi:lipid A disaccharide synthetase
MTYDAKCFALATAFMEDYPELLREESTRPEELAQAIQTAIDDKISDFALEDDKEYQQARREYMAEYDALHNRLECDDDPRSQAYAERVYEAADMERKRILEEGK